MTNAEKLTNIKLLLGIADDSTDDKLNAYLTLSEQEIIQYLYSFVGIPENATVPPEYEITQIQSIIVACTVEGAEGEDRHHENGIIRVFKYEDMVAYIRSHVFPYVGV